MLPLLLTLGALACNHAAPKVSPAEAQLLSASDKAIDPDRSICPPNYTFLANIVAWSFTRGKNATRIRRLLENHEQLQCMNSTLCRDQDLLPDFVTCQLKFAGQRPEWSCHAPNISAASIVNAEVSCENEHSFSFCILNDSCILRYELSGWHTWKIVAIVTGVFVAFGIIGVISAYLLRRR